VLTEIFEQYPPAPRLSPVGEGASELLARFGRVSDRMRPRVPPPVPAAAAAAMGRGGKPVAAGSVTALAKRADVGGFFL